MSNTLGRFLGLIILTAVAAAVAVWVTVSGWTRTMPETGDGAGRVLPKIPVSVLRIEPESIEITDAYSGMIRPFERYSLGFEIAGRVEALGSSSADKPLDEGDRVAEGQLLAELDSRVYAARVREIEAQWTSARAQLKDTKARLEQAQSNMRRAEELRDRTVKAITDTEYQEYVTALVTAQAQSEQAAAMLEQIEAQHVTAKKNLQDTKLLSPVSGVICKRQVNAGESVSPHQIVMEIIQVDSVLLVLGVPEAYVGEIAVGQRVHVELLARNRLGRERPKTEGSVYRVAEAADQTSGLFEVEILLSNAGGRWRPGLIALGRIVIDRVEGFRVPMSCAVFRDEETFLFTVDEQGTARRLAVSGWIEQGGEMILADLPPQRRTVVKQGQHRLVEGRQVEFVQSDEQRPAELASPPPVRAAAQLIGSKGQTER